VPHTLSSSSPFGKQVQSKPIKEGCSVNTDEMESASALNAKSSTKQSLIQQQIREVYLDTMQKMQMQAAGIASYPNLSKINPNAL